LDFTIKDTGSGISEEKIKNIYEDKACTNELGLPICMKLVEMLGGTIKIKSMEGSGTVINCRLPVLVKIRKLIPQDYTNFNEIVRVAVVEDNIVNQTVMQNYLKIIGINEIDLYDNGEEAYNRVNITTKLVLMDIHMPIMDGYTCIQKLREKGITCPIIVITANTMSGEREKCIKLGANDLVCKPLQLEKMKSLIEKYLK
jgi:CheY-like chemotaxis protein